MVSPTTVRLSFTLDEFKDGPTLADSFDFFISDRLVGNSAPPFSSCLYLTLSGGFLVKKVTGRYYFFPPGRFQI